MPTKYAVWSWDERSRSWMAVSEGTERQMTGELDQKQRAAAKHMPEQLCEFMPVTLA